MGTQSQTPGGGGGGGGRNKPTQQWAHEYGVFERRQHAYLEALCC